MTNAAQILANPKANNIVASLWEKGDLKRIYLQGVGNNTNKMSQKLWLNLETLQLEAKTECDTQPYTWCNKQSQMLIEKYQGIVNAAIAGKAKVSVWFVDEDGCIDTETGYLDALQEQHGEVTVIESSLQEFMDKYQNEVFSETDLCNE